MNDYYDYNIFSDDYEDSQVFCIEDEECADEGLPSDRYESRMRPTHVGRRGR